MEHAIPDLTGAAWRTSTYSGGNGGHCVETAPLGAHVGVRDSKNADGPALVVTSTQWGGFLALTRAPRP